VILLADRANRRPPFKDVELLELLASQAAGSLRMAGAVARLRDRASRDPLTGLHASPPVLPARAGAALTEAKRLGGNAVRAD
jgi:hypothetical protein